jgi:hypothetical protein
VEDWRQHFREEPTWLDRQKDAESFITYVGATCKLTFLMNDDILGSGSPCASKKIEGWLCSFYNLTYCDSALRKQMMTKL